jgi:hypothetical protein
VCVCACACACVCLNVPLSRVQAQRSLPLWMQHTARSTLNVQVAAASVATVADAVVATAV